MAKDQLTPTLMDKNLSFSIPEKHCRGRAVRLGPLLDDILSAHNYPSQIKSLLSEAVCLTSLLSALLKEEEAQLTLQAQTESGVISLLACDYKDGDVRGYIKFDAEWLVSQPLELSLMALFGKGVSGHHLRSFRTAWAFSRHRASGRSQSGRSRTKIFHAVRANTDCHPRSAGHRW